MLLKARIVGPCLFGVSHCYFIKWSMLKGAQESLRLSHGMSPVQYDITVLNSASNRKVCAGEGTYGRH
jgi:hypothetical protein